MENLIRALALCSLLTVHLPVFSQSPQGVAPPNGEDDLYPQLFNLAFIPSAGFSTTRIQPAYGLSGTVSSKPTMTPAKNREHREKANTYFRNGKPYLAEQELTAALSYYFRRDKKREIGNLPVLFLAYPIEELIPTQSLNPDEYDEVCLLLNELGMAYAETGRFSVASKLYLTTMQLFIDKNQSKEIPKIAHAAFNNAAVLLYQNGVYHLGMDLLEQINVNHQKSRIEAGAGVSMIAYANYLQMAKYGQSREDAGSMFEDLLRASAYYEKKHPERSKDLMLNAIYHAADLGLLDVALGLAAQQLGASMEDNNLSGHAAMLMQAMAYANFKSGQYKDAERMLDQAIEAYSKKFPLDQEILLAYAPLKIDILLALADYGSVISFMDQVKSTLLRDYGPTHPMYRKMIFITANTYWRMGNIPSAATTYNSYLDHLKNYLINYRAVFGREKQLVLQAQADDRIDEILSFISDNPGKYDQMLGKILEIKTLTKRPLFQEKWRERGDWIAKEDDATRETYWNWVNTKEALVGQDKLPKDQRPNTSPALINAQLLEMEEGLKKKLPYFDQHFATNHLSATALSQQLATDQAAVEIIRYRKSIKGTTFEKYGYAAIGLSKENPAFQVAFWDDSQEVEQVQYDKWGQAIIQQSDLTAAQSYYWSPIASTIGKSKTIWLSNDGIFHSINLETLTPKGFEINVLNSLENIGTTLSKDKTSGQLMLAGALLEESKTIADAQSLEKKELDQVRNILATKQYQPKILGGPVMNKRAFVERVGGSEIIHLTTNLLAYPQPDYDQSSFRDRNREKYIVPFDKNGVILDKAFQLAIDEQRGLGNLQSGVLTGSEIGKLDLSQTRLVTISGHPAIGGPNTNPASIGFIEKGFFNAGAQSILHGLWKVDGQARNLYIGTFYSSFAVDGDIRAAYRNAQSAVKKKYNHPYYWAGYILVTK